MASSIRSAGRLMNALDSSAIRRSRATRSSSAARCAASDRRRSLTSAIDATTKRTVRCLQGTQGELDGEFGAVLPATQDRDGLAPHAARRERAPNSSQAVAARGVRHQDVDLQADELVAGVAELPLQLTIGDDDGAGAVEDQHGAGRGLQRQNRDGSQVSDRICHEHAWPTSSPSRRSAATAPRNSRQPRRRPP